MHAVGHVAQRGTFRTVVDVLDGRMQRGAVHQRPLVQQGEADDIGQAGGGQGPRHAQGFRQGGHDARVQEMGKQIAADYAGKELVVIVLLKGAAWFATDLTRAIDMPLRVDFMVASSYGNGTSTSGSVKG